MVNRCRSPWIGVQRMRDGSGLAPWTRDPRWTTLAAMTLTSESQDAAGAPDAAGPGPHAACARCGGPGKSRCARCRSVCYCSADCQRAAWGEHKGSCAAAVDAAASAAAAAAASRLASPPSESFAGAVGSRLAGAVVAREAGGALASHSLMAAALSDFDGGAGASEARAEAAAAAAAWDAARAVKTLRTLAATAALAARRGGGGAVIPAHLYADALGLEAAAIARACYCAPEARRAFAVAGGAAALAAAMDARQDSAGAAAHAIGALLAAAEDAGARRLCRMRVCVAARALAACVT